MYFSAENFGITSLQGTACEHPHLPSASAPTAEGSEAVLASAEGEQAHEETGRGHRDALQHPPTPEETRTCWTLVHREHDAMRHESERFRTTRVSEGGKQGLWEQVSG